MSRSSQNQPQPRPLLGLFLLLVGGASLFTAAYLLLGTLSGLTSGGADAEFRGFSGVLLLAGVVVAVPGAAAAWAGWRLLTR